MGKDHVGERKGGNTMIEKTTEREFEREGEKKIKQISHELLKCD